jgi:putative ABC transport system ATP-binding protein
MRAMLSIQGLARRFGPRPILDALALELAAGEYVAVVGESGAGKSTLLNLIAGLDSPDAGRIVIGGEDITHMDEDARTRLRRVKVGFVFQAFHILPHLTIAQNVELPLVLLGVDPAERRARTGELLAAVGLGDRGESPPRELVHRPALLLADEPTGNLDPDTADTVLDLLARTIKAQGAAGILVTHSLHAAATADRVLRLEHGRLREDSRAAT